MDLTRRRITKIAREVSKFTVRTLKAEGIGASEFDVIHAVRKNPGITQAEICRILGTDKGAVAGRPPIWRKRDTCTGRKIPQTGAASRSFPLKRHSR